MKLILITTILFPFLLHAETYLFSGGKNNLVMIIASKVLEKAYERAGLEMTPLFIPLEESLQRSNSGQTDGELARIEKITKLYPNLRQVPVEIAAVEAVAFSKNSSLSIKEWSDLAGHELTIVKGTKFIEKATENIPRRFVSSFTEAVQALESNTTEIIVIPKLAGLNLNLEAENKNLKVVSGTLKKLPLYHFVHKKNVHLIPIITPVLQKMKESGEIDYIRKAYLRSITS